MKKSGTDIVFITRITHIEDIGDLSLYKPIRMEIDGKVADISFLRDYAGGHSSLYFSGRVREQLKYFGGSPVLTPYFLEEYFESNNISFESIPCLESGWAKLRSLTKEDIKVIALSTTWVAGANVAQGLRDAAKRIKEMFPDVPVIAGGVNVQKGIHSRHLLDKGMVSVDKEELANMFLGIDGDKDRCFDCLVFGSNPEGTLKNIVRRIKDGKDFSALPNIAIPTGEGYRINERVETTGAIHSTAINWQKYYEKVFPMPYPIYTSEGCPYKCEFCDFFPLSMYAERGDSYLTAELRSIKKLPMPRNVFFTDDNLGVKKNRLKNMLKLMIKEKLKLSWQSFMRADVVDEGIAELLKESGCDELFLGIESGDPTVLVNMNKKLNLDKAQRAVYLLDRVGINSTCTFVVGFPGESSKTIDNTIQWISSMPSGKSANAINRYYLFRFILVPLSPIAQKGRAEQFDLTGAGESWVHSTMSSVEAGEAMKDMFLRITGPTHYYLEVLPFEWPKRVTREILELRDEAQKKMVVGDKRGEVCQRELVRAVEKANRKYALNPIKKHLATLYYRTKNIRSDRFEV